MSVCPYSAVLLRSAARICTCVEFATTAIRYDLDDDGVGTVTVLASPPSEDGTEGDEDDGVGMTNRSRMSSLQPINCLEIDKYSFRTLCRSKAHKN